VSLTQMMPVRRTGDTLSLRARHIAMAFFRLVTCTDRRRVPGYAGVRPASTGPPCDARCGRPHYPRTSRPMRISMSRFGQLVLLMIFEPSRFAPNLSLSRFWKLLTVHTQDAGWKLGSRGPIPERLRACGQYQEAVGNAMEISVYKGRVPVP
jgi:hypothetical protein